MNFEVHARGLARLEPMKQVSGDDMSGLFPL